MADLINRDDAYEILTEYYHHRTEIQHKNLREALSRVPSAQPEIVKCRDCKHFKYIKQIKKRFCMLDEGMCEAEPDDFCSRGVRK